MLKTFLSKYRSALALWTYPYANQTDKVAKEILESTAWGDAITAHLTMEGNILPPLPTFSNVPESQLPPIYLSEVYNDIEPDKETLYKAKNYAQEVEKNGGIREYPNALKNSFLELCTCKVFDQNKAFGIVQKYNLLNGEFNPDNTKKIIQALEEGSSLEAFKTTITELVQSKPGINEYYKVFAEWMTGDNAIIDQNKVSTIIPNLDRIIEELSNLKAKGNEKELSQNIEQDILAKIGNDDLTRYLSDRNQILESGNLIDVDTVVQRNAISYFKSIGIDSKPEQIYSFQESSSITVGTAIITMCVAHEAVGRPGRKPEENIILVVEPYWEPEVMYAVAMGNKIVTIPTSHSNDKVSAEQLRQVIEETGIENIAGMIFTSPNNTSLSVYSKDEMQDIADVIAEYKLRTVSDELYSGMERPGTEHIPLASLTSSAGQPMHNFVCTSYGTSKTLNLQDPKFSVITTGDQEWMKTIERNKNMCTTPDGNLTPPESSKLIGSYFLANMPQDYIADMKQLYADRADQVAEMFKSEDVSMSKHEAGYFSCINVSRDLCESYGIKSSTDLFEYLAVVARVETKFVSVQPNDSISVRFNFYENPQDVKLGIERVEKLSERMREGLEDKSLAPPTYDEMKTELTNNLKNSRLLTGEIRDTMYAR